MNDSACVAFLQEVLPRLGMRWAGFRKVRRQVCRRVGRRLRELGLENADAYRAYLDAHPEERAVLDALCRITISRFYRDRGVFDVLRDAVLPDLAQRATGRGAAVVRCWSAGCASGEEVYTLKIVWEQDLQPRFPHLGLHVSATDAGVPLLDRARRGCYPKGALKELPAAWTAAAFTRSGDEYCVQAAFRDGIEWLHQDVRHAAPEGPFDLVLCRNLVFTYFDDPTQRACLARIAAGLRPHGVLVLGKHEFLPDGSAGFTALDEHKAIYQRVDAK